MTHKRIGLPFTYGNIRFKQPSMLLFDHSHADLGPVDSCQWNSAGVGYWKGIYLLNQGAIVYVYYFPQNEPAPPDEEIIRIANTLINLVRIAGDAVDGEIPVKEVR